MSHTLTPAGYIEHHLKFMEYDLRSIFPQLKSGFWVIHLDTIFVSLFIGLLVFLFIYYKARQFTVDKPSRFQVAIEMVFQFIEDQVRDTIGEVDRFSVALSFTIFVWVVALNFMDMLPVDLIPYIAGYYNIPYFRSVPTADMSMTFALSIAVSLILIQQSISHKGLKNYLYEFVAHPFPWYLFFVNIPFRMIEEFSRPVSLSLRLFGNIYAGELIFILIALAPLVPQWASFGLWWLLHLFIITLQAFIFMILSLVYLQGARSSH